MCFLFDHLTTRIFNLIIKVFKQKINHFGAKSFNTLVFYFLTWHLFLCFHFFYFISSISPHPHKKKKFGFFAHVVPSLPIESSLPCIFFGHFKYRWTRFIVLYHSIFLFWGLSNFRSPKCLSKNPKSEKHSFQDE